jgi:H+/Cl- antiporter ClcA
LKSKKPLPDYAKYSGLGLQMALFVVFCTFAGRYIDKLKWTEFPLFTIIGVFVGVFGAMYYLIKKIK